MQSRPTSGARTGEARCGVDGNADPTLVAKAVARTQLVSAEPATMSEQGATGYRRTSLRRAPESHSANNPPSGTPPSTSEDRDNIDLTSGHSHEREPDRGRPRHRSEPVLGRDNRSKTPLSASRLARRLAQRSSYEPLPKLRPLNSRNQSRRTRRASVSNPIRADQ